MFSGLLASKLLYSITLTLLHFLWQGGVIALGLKITLQITSTQKAQLRYALASLAMLLNLILPLATFYLIYNADIILPIAPSLLDQIVPINPNTFALFSSYILNTFTLLSPYIALSWIFICSLLTLKLSLELHQVKRLASKDSLPPSEALLAQFTQLSEQLNLRFPPKLIISLKTDVPMAVGVFKPMVLLPFSMVTGLTPEQLNMLILHELAHIRRHDYLINIIQTLIDTLFFFHPCCYWVSKQVRKEREYCCDDIAVNHCHNPVAYAHTLADTASLCHKHRHHSIPRMAMAASGGDLTLRVLRLVKANPVCTSSLYFPKGLALLGMLMVGMCLGIQLYMSFHSPHNVGHNQSNQASTTLIHQGMTSASFSYDLDSLDIFSKYKDEYQTFSSAEKSTLSPVKVKLEGLSATQETLESLLQASAVDVVDADKNTIALENNTSKNHLNPSNDSVTELLHTSQEIAASENLNTGINQAAIETLSTATELSEANIKQLPTDIEIELAEITETSTSHDVQFPIETSEIALEQVDTSKVMPLKSQENIKSMAPAEDKNTTDETATVIAKKNTAELIKSIEPRYPAAAQLRGVELDVLVNFTVNTEGKVEGIEFESISKSHYFKNSIRSAMKKWRFLPAQENGKPVESTMKKIFSFNLLT